MDYYSNWKLKNPDYHKNYYAKNKEKLNTYHKMYYAKNREIIQQYNKQYQKEYYKNLKEKIMNDKIAKFKASLQT
jgi:hypothetical protein